MEISGPSTLEDGNRFHRVHIFTGGVSTTSIDNIPVSSLLYEEKSIGVLAFMFTYNTDMSEPRLLAKIAWQQQLPHLVPHAFMIVTGKSKFLKTHPYL